MIYLHSFSIPRTLTLNVWMETHKKVRVAYTIVGGKLGIKHVVKCSAYKWSKFKWNKKKVRPFS